MEFRPILSALKRNKTGAILIAAQMALTMTIIVNAVFMINERQSQMDRPSGLDESNVFVFGYSGFAKDFNERVQLQEDLNYIRGLPGVVDAVQSNSAPLIGGGWSMSLNTESNSDTNGTGTAIYFADHHGMDAFGLKLIAGRNFEPNEITWRGRTSTSWPGQGIITQELAKQLFKDDWQNAIDKTVYISDDQPIKIIGIIEKMQAPWNGWRGLERSLLVPQQTEFGGARIIVRTEPGQRDRLMREVEEGLLANYKGRLIRRVQSMDDIRERSYRSHNGMNTILSTLVIALIVVTALGIVGLASFSVNRRRKQIGTRRALGATKIDIMRYFLLENFIISSFGIVLGVGMTLGLNMLLVSALDLPRIDWYYIPIGMLALWVIGLVAVYGPARKACAISPAIATRSV
ncbi:ABC transporter permease [Pleionea litopenaei]|uniref:FtsX-like permease family protein n=1 Tax=Pleionea litopenaei TaxID=3070815 RepID=A0AA51RWS4_9GAMM|nr:FtsX-like permease family protein [Pleionea sp. HL-JVS1]WMS89086.1 FtsX-like permease family protein [Pleionea sp. HL-JVS1]